ncbi:hypothetical protein FHT93_006626 [Rhizobium sp. BK379]|nr:hypothetical protein [Rhizobium sp. BK379]
MTKAPESATASAINQVAAAGLHEQRAAGTDVQLLEMPMLAARLTCNSPAVSPEISACCLAQG